MQHSAFFLALIALCELSLFLFIYLFFQYPLLEYKHQNMSLQDDVLFTILFSSK